jgi:MFS family permease
MESAFDGNLIARVLLTLATLGYGAITIKADFNKTHATNPQWTPHARFHVVWQILSYSGIGLIALGLTWLNGPLPRERLYLAAALAIVMYAAFFIAALARPVFAGKLYDENGYLPFRPPVGPDNWRWDLNVTVFTIMAVITIAAILIIR